jgi:hypothetical protein
MSLITNKQIKMFTWNEIVAVSLLPILRDPELVIYFMSILKPLRRDLVEEEARVWHQSLRTTQEERWKRVSELSMKRKFSHMNASVPISCTLPFDGGMWRNSKDLLKMIRYFHLGFIRSDRRVNGETRDDTISNKIEIVNLMNDKSTEGVQFRSEYSISEIETALNDMITYKTDPELPDLEWEELPYITVECCNTSSIDLFLRIMN